MIDRHFHDFADTCRQLGLKHRRTTPPLSYRGPRQKASDSIAITLQSQQLKSKKVVGVISWRPRRDSNPCYRRERAVS